MFPSGEPSRKNNYFCNICNKSGHTPDRCFKNPSNPRFEGGGPSGMQGGFMPPKYFCDICQKPGHTADRCFKNNQGGPLNPGDIGGGRPGGKPSFFCDFCKKPGHTADRCFKNPNNPNMHEKPTPVKFHCDICNKDGHTADRCFKNPNNENSGFPGGPKPHGGPPKYFCEICEKPGHTADRCFKNPDHPKNQQGGGMFGGGFPGGDSFHSKPMGGGGAKYFCQYCQKPGHTADRCFKNPNNSGGGMGVGPTRSPVTRFCENCNNPGHTAEYCQMKGFSGGMGMMNDEHR